MVEHNVEDDDFSKILTKVLTAGYNFNGYFWFVYGIYNAGDTVSACHQNPYENVTTS